MQLDNDHLVAIKRISQPWGIHGTNHSSQVAAVVNGRADHVTALLLGASRRFGKDSPEALRHAELAYREIRVLKFLKVIVHVPVGHWSQL